MKKILTAVLFLSCSVAFAQQTVTVTRKTMTGAEFNTRFPKVTDSKIYDFSGNVIDSAKAAQMVKTFDYSIGMATPQGQTEYKHVLMKANHSGDLWSDKQNRITFRPKSPKLLEGAVLDITPLAKHTDITKLQGKAIVLLFRARQYPAMYSRINDAVANNIANNKFEVFAITDLSYEDAINAQKADPILNAHNIVEARDITDFYDTTGETLIVVTNAQHQVTYAVKSQVGLTPWVLNNLLKSL